MCRVGLLLAIMAAALVVASGVALAVVRTGGPGDDYLRGTDGPDALSGKGGGDVLLGLRGDDALYGGAGRDFVGGGSEARPKPATGLFQAGREATSSGPGGAPTPCPAARAGTFSRMPNSGKGSRRTSSPPLQRPAARDIIDCGGGFDRALVDREDITSDCERLFFSFRALEEALTPAEERYYFALFERL